LLSVSVNLFRLNKIQNLLKLLKKTIFSIRNNFHQGQAAGKVTPATEHRYDTVMVVAAVVVEVTVKVEVEDHQMV